MAKPQKITPFLWFDKEARQAAKFYAKAFRGSKVKKSVFVEGGPSGRTEIVPLKLLGQDLTLMSAGPYFKFSPAVSFMVNCRKKKDVDALYKKLSPGGSAMMELGEYPFSERYVWLLDKFGMSWQLICLPKEGKSKITPTLLFVGAQLGKAKEAIELYRSVFKKSKLGKVQYYGKEEGPNVEGSVKFAPFKLAAHPFAAMDGAGEHDFRFNEALSFVVKCKGQKEVDHYWKKLSADPKAEQCGWLKDKFGVSWQVVPTVLDKLLQSKDKKKVARVTEAFMQMKKFDIKALKKAAKAPKAVKVKVAH